MHLVDNERTKLTASWGNTVAAAFIAAGAVAPVAAILYGLTALPITPARMLALRRITISTCECTIWDAASLSAARPVHRLASIARRSAEGHADPYERFAAQLIDGLIAAAASAVPPP
jgi:L-alanine-DL-glutamate epimerase-like enolase superfamily enzyme